MTGRIASTRDVLRVSTVWSGILLTQVKLETVSLTTSSFWVALSITSAENLTPRVSGTVVVCSVTAVGNGLRDRQV